MSTQIIQSDRLTIRHVLYANAVLSAACGALFVAAARPVAAFLGLDAWGVILDLGLVMIAYAALLYFNIKRAAISRNFVLFTVIADSLWVAGSILLLLAGWVPFTVDGRWAVGLIALGTDIFATLQFLAWRKM